MSSVTIGIVVVLAAMFSAALVLALLPALRRHAMVKPNARSSHRYATPQGGGIGVIAATLVVAAVAIALITDLPGPLWLMLGATAMIAVVGAWDDLHPIEVAPRLILQVVAIGAMLASLPGEMRIVPDLPWWLERMALLLGCLWFVNLTNFMDGIDWMSVAEFVPLAAGLAAIGWLGGLPPYGTIVALALGGALVGFAPFNRPEARLFLGDVGSLPIGLIFAWLLVLLAGSGHLAAAILLPLYYVGDATITLLRRMWKGEPFWQAHRTHFYQRATDRGLSVIQIVTGVFFVNVALVALAIVTVWRPTALIEFLALGGGVILVWWLLVILARGKM